MFSDRKARIVLLIVIGTMTILGLVACASNVEESSDVVMEETVDGEAMLQSSCTTCHGLDTVTSKQKTRDAWEETVDRMIQKGADVMDKEALLDYLAENYGS